MCQVIEFLESLGLDQRAHPDMKGGNVFTENVFTEMSRVKTELNLSDASQTLLLCRATELTSRSDNVLFVLSSLQ